MNVLKKNESNFLFINKQDKFNHIFENRFNTILFLAYFKIFKYISFVIKDEIVSLETSCLFLGNLLLCYSYFVTNHIYSEPTSLNEYIDV